MKQTKFTIYTTMPEMLIEALDKYQESISANRYEDAEEAKKIIAEMNMLMGQIQFQVEEAA